MTRMVSWNNGQVHVAEIATGESHRNLRTPIVSQDTEDACATNTHFDADETGPFHHRRARGAGVQKCSDGATVDLNSHESQGETRIISVGNDLERHAQHARTLWDHNRIIGAQRGRPSARVLNTDAVSRGPPRLS